jgi:hypothetical protein
VAECVEIASAPNVVLIRDSKDPTGLILRCVRPEFEAFLHGVKAGDLD